MWASLMTQPGGQDICRPPRMWMWRWYTDWAASRPLLITILYPLLFRFSFSATFLATHIKWPRRGMSSSVLADNCIRGFLGITKMCFGAAGLTSRKATALSSSYTISAGISFRIILLNIESSGLYFSAASEASLAFSTSSLHLLSVHNSEKINLGATVIAAAAVKRSLLAKMLLLRRA